MTLTVWAADTAFATSYSDLLVWEGKGGCSLDWLAQLCTLLIHPDLSLTCAYAPAARSDESLLRASLRASRQVPWQGPPEPARERERGALAGASALSVRWPR